MPVKLKYSSETLLNKKFKEKGVGYDSFDVDSTFDEVITDYKKIENNVLLTKEEFESLKKEIAELRKSNIDLKIQVDNEKGKMKYIKKDGKDIHIDNLVLLKRIGKLEQIIHDKLHIDPDEINTNFDPDDC